MALLVLLLFFHLILDINSQYVPQPRLLVSPEVLTVSGSVQLHCSSHGVKVSQCYFYPERDDTNLKLSPSCQLIVTGSELIRWTGSSSPGPLHIICYYAVNNSGICTPSPHSLPAPVTVLNQKPILNVPHDDQLDEVRLVCEIPESESVRADFSCNLYTGENPQPYLTQTSQKTQSGKLVCVFTAERNDLFRRLQSVKSGEVSCDYSLISDPTARSLMSDKYNMTSFLSLTTQASISTEKSTAYSSPKPTQTSPKPTQTSPKPTQTSPKPTQTSPKSTQTSPKPTQTSPKPTQTSPKSTQSSSEPMWPSVTTEHPAAGSMLIVLSVTGVCVLLVGLVSICLCLFIRKKKTQRPCDQGVMMSMFDINKSGSEAADSYSSSARSPSQPLDPKGDKKTLDNVIYDHNSITDTQVTTKTEDAVYSLPLKY